LYILWSAFMAIVLGTEEPETPPRKPLARFLVEIMKIYGICFAVSCAIGIITAIWSVP
jgi:hypothetical protein